MTAESLFSLASAVVMPGWLLLALAPRWRYTARLIGAVLIPGLLGALYVTLVAVRWGGAEGGFGSLADVRRLYEAA